jgi:hypothetical protein
MLNPAESCYCFSCTESQQSDEPKKANSKGEVGKDGDNNSVGFGCLHMPCRAMP